MRIAARGCSLRRQNRFRSRCPSREIPRRARQAPARGRHRPVCRGEGRVLPLHRRSVCRAGIHARAGVRRGRVRDHRRRLRRPADGRAAARGGLRKICASSRAPATSAAPGTGTAIPARCATWNPTATCRCSKSSATCRSTNIRSRRRSSSTASASRGTTASTTTRCCRPRSPSCAGTRTPQRWIVCTNRGDRFKAQYVAMANGPLQPAEAARHSRHQRVQGLHVPHQPLGLPLHRRRQLRQPAPA